jgi:hypothetical protein
MSEDVVSSDDSSDKGKYLMMMDVDDDGCC